MPPGSSASATAAAGGGGGDNVQPISIANPNKRELSSRSNLHQLPRKRRKKCKGKNSKKFSNQNQIQIKNKKRNWIERCSESVHRIPSDSAAPLRCAITRAEIEEDPLCSSGVHEVKEGDSFQRHRHSRDRDAQRGQDEIILDGPTRSVKALQKVPNIATVKDENIFKGKKIWSAKLTVRVDGGEKKLFIPVERHSSAIGQTKWAQQRKKSCKQLGANTHLPDGDNGDGIKNPFPSSSIPDKFWAQRKRLFSRYDEGVQIGGIDDPHMWYSVTPEKIANHVAGRVLQYICDNQPSHDKKGTHWQKDILILDVFCGCGGNSIAFAQQNNFLSNQNSDNSPHVKVIAVDNNLSRLKRAAHNAAIYEIKKDQIVFIHADAIEVLNQFSKGALLKNKKKVGLTYGTCADFTLGGIELLTENVDGIFLSPPWGGLDYEIQGGMAGYDPTSSISITSSIEQIKQAAGHEKDGDSGVITNGGELLDIASKAVLDNSKGVGLVAYFLPRNTNGISLGQMAVSSGLEGCFELEQNVINGKIKTVTAYFGPCVNAMLNNNKG